MIWKFSSLYQLINKKAMIYKILQKLHARTHNSILDRMNLPSSIDGISCLKWMDSLQFSSYSDIWFSNNTDVQEIEGISLRLGLKFNFLDVSVVGKSHNVTIKRQLASILNQRVLRWFCCFRTALSRSGGLSSGEGLDAVTWWVWGTPYKCGN